MRLNPKKSLGQNFLVDAGVLRKIVSALSPGPEDTVLEIGAGRGEFTAELAATGAEVFALEIDRQLCQLLEDKFKSAARVKIIEADVLKFDLSGIAALRKIKVAGNIPYYITSPIIERLISWRGMVSKAYLTVQKEFALRLCASAGGRDYGSFSCFAQYYTRPKLEFLIKAGSFFPRPKVDSALVSLQMLNQPAVQVSSEEKMFELIRAAFSQRRKMLANSLKGRLEPEIIFRVLEESGLGAKARPEELSLELFARLADCANKS